MLLYPLYFYLPLSAYSARRLALCFRVECVARTLHQHSRRGLLSHLDPKSPCLQAYDAGCWPVRWAQWNLKKLEWMG